MKNKSLYDKTIDEIKEQVFEITPEYHQYVKHALLGFSSLSPAHNLDWLPAIESYNRSLGKESPNIPQN